MRQNALGFDLKGFDFKTYRDEIQKQKRNGEQASPRQTIFTDLRKQVTMRDDCG